MRVVVSAGEPSGRVMSDLFRQAMGSIEPRCEVVSLEDTVSVKSVLGFWEGLMASGRLRFALSRAEERVRALKPDAVVLIAFSGFHLPLGRRLRRLGFPVLYLSPPQVWAWGGFRIRTLRKAADRVVCLFHFEEELLRRAGVDAVYLGYPLLDAVTSTKSRPEVLRQLGFGAEERYVAFLPGSRPAEVAYHRPLFRTVFTRLPATGQCLRGVMIAEPEGTEPDGMAATRQNRYDLMRHAECTLVVSGTATAECAILGTPMIVCYHLAPASRVLAHLLVRSRFFALPNILAGHEVVPEYLEPDAERLAAGLRNLLVDEPRRRRMAADLHSVARGLGPGGAMRRIAAATLEQAARSEPLS